MFPKSARFGQALEGGELASGVEEGMRAELVVPNSRQPGELFLFYRASVKLTGTS